MNFLKETGQITLNLLKIRLLQAFRILKQLGLLYSIILLIICLVAGVNIFQPNISDNQAYIYTGLCLFTLSSVHFSRKDDFILNMISKHAIYMMLSEYILATSPISIHLLVNGKYEAVLMLLVGILLLILFGKKFNTERKNHVPQLPFLKYYEFEWISGLRQSYLVLLFIFIMAASLVFVPFLSLLFVWYISLSIASFYQEFESIEVLLLHEGTINQFLTKKVLIHLKNYWIFNLPVLVLYYFFHPEHWLILLLLIVFITLGLIFTILNKYASYEPASTTVGNSVLITIVFGSVLIPFFAPVPVFLIFRKYFAAKTNLNSYFKR
ncbi:hypothetical protein [Chondrinema litorale]|uniref:hypothetical protein n=1 Tax=Chondrinema litorale TaxID=2994555 RepID=UPI002543DC82|nr:hypothetical protein [Chondrinema litorale]UZR99920.1 hypothetical protein OQ292_38760 [Chondrinema litorale]